MSQENNSASRGKHIALLLGITAVVFAAVAFVGSGGDSVSKDEQPAKVTDVKSATPFEQR